MRIVLLDRDGTIIAEPPDNRVDAPDKIKLLPDSLEALRYLTDHDFAVIFVTNQAGIAEGRLTMDDFERMHAEVLRQIAPSGIRVLKTYVCPHTSEDGCICRKPKPAMLQWAARDFGFRLDQTYMVGDRPTDVAAGQAADAKTILLGADAPTLLDAAYSIVANASQVPLAELADR